MHMSPEQLDLTARRTERLLWLAAGFFIVTHALGTYSREVLGHDEVFGLVPLLPLREGGLQTWYASLTLAACAGLLAVIGLKTRWRRAPHARQWLVLAVGFLFLSADEGAQIHERLVLPTYTLLQLPAIMRYSAWVLPYLVIAAVLAVMYIPFLRALQMPVRRMFILAGVLYVGGAAGMELLSAPLQLSGVLPQMWAELVVEILEELGEMGGIAIFARALLSQLAILEGSRTAVRAPDEAFPRSTTTSRPATTIAS